MIPKIIHYCWFGDNPLPPLAKKCIRSWQKYLPDYELMCWNESNFDLKSFPYAEEAYNNKKFAFVTDVVRMYVLYELGGIYMDTDVEVLKPLDSFLSLSAFSGFENQEYVPTGIIASEKHGSFAKEMLDYYNGRHFVLDNGQLDLTTNVVTITNLLVSKGLKRDNTYQDFPNYITLFPNDYFCPKVWGIDKITLTSNSHTIHHFLGSWKQEERGLLFRFCKNHGLMGFYHFIENIRLSIKK